MADLGKQPFYLSAEQMQWVEDTLAGLSIEQKAGQLFCVMGGDYPLGRLKEMVRDGRVGGILYRPAPAGEIRANYEELDAVTPVPLLKAANLEEGGAGAISDGTLFGWPMLAAAADDPEQTEHFALSAASEGKEAGINWTFSPVCDLDRNFQNPITNVRTCGSDLLPVTKDQYDSIRLIILGNDTIPGGTMSETAKSFLENRGFAVDIYQPFSDDLHGTKKLAKRRLTLYLANYEQASNQTTVRIHWCRKHALDSPRFLNEEPCIFVSFANPYLLQDVPRMKTYINAYTATKVSVQVVLEKLLGEGKFTGVSPVDAFCGLPDTKI